MALAGVALVAGVLLLVNAEAGFVGSTVSYPFGWVSPLVAAGILGLAAWVLLGGRPSSNRTPDRTDSAQCAKCGREILGQWRMCPYCGSVLGPSEQPRERPAGTTGQ